MSLPWHRGVGLVLAVGTPLSCAAAVAAGGTQLTVSETLLLRPFFVYCVLLWYNFITNNKIDRYPLMQFNEFYKLMILV